MVPVHLYARFFFSIFFFMNVKPDMNVILEGQEILLMRVVIAGKTWNASAKCFSSLEALT